MDLRDALLRFAAGRPHVLVIASPGGTAVRLVVEVELARRRWPVAMGPADADLLVVTGAPGPALAEVTETLWQQVPAPRARAVVADAAETAPALDAAVRELADSGVQEAPSEGHTRQHEPTPSQDTHDGHGGDDMGSHGHHLGHDMRGMEMPGGLAMAGRVDDRDGLKLDQLHVPLGPVLPDWPAGLVVRGALQGDVVQHAEVEVLDRGRGSAFWDEPWLLAAAGEQVPRGTAARRLAGRNLDGLARLLGVTGWSPAAVQARELRAAVLADTPSAVVRPSLEAFAGRVGRSRTLRWLTAGIATGAGDVHGQLRQRLTDAMDAVARFDDAEPLDSAEPRPPRTLPGQLPPLLIGLELAALRLVVAGLDPDTDATAEVAHG